MIFLVYLRVINIKLKVRIISFLKAGSVTFTATNHDYRDVKDFFTVEVLNVDVSDSDKMLSYSWVHFTEQPLEKYSLNK